MSNRAQLQEIHMLEEFVCEAIHNPVWPRATPNQQGQNGELPAPPKPVVSSDGNTSLPPRPAASMKPDLNSPASVVHRLLFQALLEIREQGTEQQNKVVFHLADLFHNIVLEMESAARGEQSYESVLSTLSETAAEKGLDRWLATTLAGLAELQAQPQSAA